MAQRLNELAERSEAWSFEHLAENDLFIDALMTAVQTAVRTSHEQKLAALRNAVVNAAVPGLVREHEVLILLRLIDELTPLHLAVLKVGAAPEDWYRNPSVNSRRDAIERAIPETRTDEILPGRLLGDLDRAHLLSIEHADAERSGHQTWLNPLGERFMKFITDPLESAANG